MIEKPYDPPLNPGTLAHVAMGRHASQFMDDIEAVLVEHELSSTLAPSVAALMDTFGGTAWWAVACIRDVLNAEAETP